MADLKDGMAVVVMFVRRGICVDGKAADVVAKAIVPGLSEGRGESTCICCSQVYDVYLVEVGSVRESVSVAFFFCLMVSKVSSILTYTSVVLDRAC